MRSHAIARIFPGHGASSLVELPPAFLAPALYPRFPPSSQCSRFSTSAPLSKRHRKFVSAIHRTGPRHPVENIPLPRPREDVPERPENLDHGLWGFFYQKDRSLPTPEEHHAHGRAWSIQELRHKSWEDLHGLWWACVRERNRIATANLERERLAAGYGEWESEDREKSVRSTQRGIKQVLLERWYAWEDATDLYNKGYRTPEMQELDSQVDSQWETGQPVQRDDGLMEAASPEEMEALEEEPGKGEKKQAS